MRSNQPDILNNYSGLIEQKDFKDKALLDLCEEVGKSLTRNSNNQVRKFYDGLRTIARRAKQANLNLYVQLTLYRARVMYSKARNDKRRGSGIDEQFQTFLVRSIDAILGKEADEQPQALGSFAEYFEAVYGYYYFYAPRENR